jgi:hypothetical protein
LCILALFFIPAGLAWAESIPSAIYDIDVSVGATPGSSASATGPILSYTATIPPTASYSASATINIILGNPVSISTYSSAGSSGTEGLNTDITSDGGTLYYYFEVYNPNVTTGTPVPINLLFDLEANGSASGGGASFGADYNYTASAQSSFAMYPGGVTSISYNATGCATANWFSDCNTSSTTGTHGGTLTATVLANEANDLYLQAGGNAGTGVAYSGGSNSNAGESSSASIEVTIGIDPTWLSNNQGTDLLVNTAVSVPEPGSLLLLGLGLAGLCTQLGRRRRL